MGVDQYSELVRLGRRVVFWGYGLGSRLAILGSGFGGPRFGPKPQKP